MDALIDRYVTWREENGALADAYEAWRRADSDDRGHAFVVYQAALDREAMAAADFRRAVDRVRAVHPDPRVCYTA